MFEGFILGPKNVDNEIEMIEGVGGGVQNATQDSFCLRMILYIITRCCFSFGWAMGGGVILSLH